MNTNELIELDVENITKVEKPKQAADKVRVVKPDFQFFDDLLFLQFSHARDPKPFVPKHLVPLQMDKVKAMKRLISLRDCNSEDLELNTYYVDMIKGTTEVSFIKHAAVHALPGSINLYVGHGDHAQFNPKDVEDMVVKTMHLAATQKALTQFPLSMEAAELRKQGQPLFAFSCCYAGWYNSLIPRNNRLNGSSYLERPFPVSEALDYWLPVLVEVEDLIENRLKANEKKKRAARQKVILNLYFGIDTEKMDNSRRIFPVTGETRFRGWQ